GIPNLVEAHVAAAGIGPGLRVLMFSSPGFVASISEIAVSLATGATLCFARRELTYGPALASTLRRLAIGCVTLPPSLLAEMGDERLPALSVLICAGEPCNPALGER